MVNNTKRILSGMQPTHSLHLGNYLGALRNWVALQKDYECLYCVVDLHALTVERDGHALRKATREVAAAYIAAGVDPDHCAIFPQSAIAGHSELAWILSCHTPLGWLNRMTQFKEKAGKKKDNAVLGLYSYPVLMAADILIYKATHVPVGEDQKQHLELARDIAGAFNRTYDKEVFTLPEPQILGEATRVMSLRDSTKKMSKSDISDYSRINLTDDADAIAKKIKKAKTDAEPLPETIDELSERPEALNLVTIFASLAERPRRDILSEFSGKGFGEFKPALAELAVEKLSPITAKMRELSSDTTMLDGILKKGTQRAAEIADANLDEIKDTIGLLRM